MREFASRDRTRVAQVKDEFWLARKRGQSPAELFALSDQLRQHVRTVRPDWPTDEERADDIAVHERVTEALRAVDSGLR